ncbi:MAG: Flp pilus assembly protein CpaB, partial [Bacteroidetes bacterium RIFOXYA12_FULL_35_11]
MRGKSLFLLLLALGCGLVASVGMTRVMAKRSPDGQSAASETDKIVVAVKDLPMGDPINAEWVKLEDWPKDKVPPGALSRMEDVEKRRPKSRVFSGSPVLEVQLFGKGESDTAVGSHIPPGYRVVSIEAIGVSSSGGLIRPGDRVDLLLCVQACPAKRIYETSTRTILQDIKVFAVDGRFRLDAEDMEKVSPTKMVSLLVNPEQAQRLTLAT